MPSDQLRNCLVSDESLKAVSSATILEKSFRETASIGMTDRRLLCVSDGGRFMDIGYDNISSIRSRRRTTTTCRGNDHRLMIAVGILLAMLAFVGVVAISSGALTPFLVVVTVGATAATEYVRRNGADIELTAVVDRVEGTIGDVDAADAIRRRKAQVNEHVNDDQLLAAGSALLAALAFIGIVIISSGFVSVLALIVIGAVALIDYAYRNKNKFDGIELVQQHHKELSIDTVGGRTVHIRIDPEEEIGRELSKFTHAADAGTPALTSTSP